MRRLAWYVCGIGAATLLLAAGCTASFQARGHAKGHAGTHASSGHGHARAGSGHHRVEVSARESSGGARTRHETRASARASVEVEVKFFGIPLDGAQDVVFVLDHSGSMSSPAVGTSGDALGMNRTESVLASIGAGIANSAAGEPMPTKMEAAKAELVHCLRNLPNGTRFNIVFFESDVTALSSRMVTLDARTRARAERFIAGIETEGSTAGVPALRAAYRSDARRVVLLSDGLANTGGDGGDLLAEARAQMEHGVRFDTVGLGLDQDAALMRTLARESGGMSVQR